MPTIPSRLLDCVYYLYQNKEDALAGRSTGGTGFLCATPTDDGLGHHYGVTNWHVAVRDGYSCIRLNTTNGPRVLELGPEDWAFEPGRDDIAIAPLNLRDPTLISMFIGASLLLTQERAESTKISPGDDVFMVGRFVDIGARETNVPAVRFGNISTLPVRVLQATGYEDGVSYCIDMHSRTGYSGSPVFVYRTPGSSLEWVLTGGPIELSGGMISLLGIHWGQFPEELPIRRRQRQARHEAPRTEKLYDEYIEGMSGMTCVIPAWQILKLLDCAALRKHRQAVEEMRKKAHDNSGTQ